jgi:hypothetical protein
MSKDIWRYFDEYIIRGKTAENPSCCDVITQRFNPFDTHPVFRG